MKIGVPSYMNPETTTGGNALKFYSTIRLEIRRIGSIKDGDNITGNRVRSPPTAKHNEGLRHVRHQ